MSIRIVTDGYLVLTWTEFTELCNRAGVKPDPEGRITLHLDCKNQGDVELYHSPEFKAFCQRAGIRHELPTTEMKIIVKDGEMPTVQHTYVLLCNESAFDEPLIVNKK